MSYFLTIYICSHAKVKENLSKDFMPEIASLLKNEDEKASMTKLLNRTYRRNAETLESEVAPKLLVSLELLCDYLSSKKETIEFYLDENKLPDLLRFSFEDWDEEDDFKLPLSPYGTPSVVYRNNKSLIEFSGRFQRMLKDNTYPKEYILQEDLQNLVTITSEAIAQNEGLFIFCWQ